MGQLKFSEKESVIPLMSLFEEMQKMGLGMVNKQTKIRCKEFEDN